MKKVYGVCKADICSSAGAEEQELFVKDYFILAAMSLIANDAWLNASAILP